MTKAQEILKADIEKINDERMIEKVRIFIMGILAQQDITERSSQMAATPYVNVHQKRM